MLTNEQKEALKFAKETSAEGTGYFIVPENETNRRIFTELQNLGYVKRIGDWQRLDEMIPFVYLPKIKVIG